MGGKTFILVPGRVLWELGGCLQAWWGCWAGCDWQGCPLARLL